MDNVTITKTANSMLFIITNRLRKTNPHVDEDILIEKAKNELTIECDYQIFLHEEIKKALKDL